MELGIKREQNGKKIVDFLFMILLFGGLIRVIAGIGYYNPQDTLWYREWALALNDGIFDIYSRAQEISLDYPPLYLFLLRAVGAVFQIIGVDCHNYATMFVMKFWPIVGDLICGYALYAVFKKISPKTGLVAAALWIFNPTTIFNSSFWGQTDGLMCLLLLISFVALNKDKPILACMLFAIAGMTKFQCLFFTPVFLVELFVRCRIKSFLKGLIAAAVTVAVVFIPFMICSKNPFLFLDVYLNGQGTYPYCTLNAYNVYGIFGLNWVKDTVGMFTLYDFSLLLVIVLIVGIIAIYLLAKRKCVWVISFLFMNTLFMFMTRMHERYQFVVLIFVLMAAMVHKHRGFFYCFIGMSVMTLINQVIPMFAWQTSESIFNNHYGDFMIIFSGANLLLYVLSAYVSIKFLFTRPKGDLSETDFKEATLKN